MSFYTGPGWLDPKEHPMTSKSLGPGYRLKDGKTIAKKPPRMAAGQRKKIEGKAKREAAAWRKTGKVRS
jgi:hypothetical protein